MGLTFNFTPSHLKRQVPPGSDVGKERPEKLVEGPGSIDRSAVLEAVFRKIGVETDRV
jgi:hypothetical protein